MHVAQFAVASLECPLLVRVEVSQSHVVDHHVLHQRIPESAWPYLSLLTRTYFTSSLPVDADLDVDVGVFLHVLALFGLIRNVGLPQ